MEVLKKKVKSRTFSKEFKNDYGTFYSFIVKFEGDDESYGYTSKEKEPKNFKVGEEQEFSVTEKPYKKPDGTDAVFKVVKPYSEFKAGGKGGGYVFNLENEKLKEKIKTGSYALSYAKDQNIAGKLKDDELLSRAKEYSDFLRREIDLVN